MLSAFVFIGLSRNFCHFREMFVLINKSCIANISCSYPQEKLLFHENYYFLFEKKTQNLSISPATLNIILQHEKI